MAGLKERLAGRYMEWEGKATGDPIRRTEGKLVVAFGRLKQAVGKIRQRGAPRGRSAGDTQPEPRRPTGR
jgi:uncharacterized protein YjbJ (UPF0337 family)